MTERRFIARNAARKCARGFAAACLALGVALSAGCSSRAPAADDGGTDGAAARLVVTPATTTLQSVDGARPTVQLALGYDDGRGATTPVAADDWSLADTRVGTIDASGLFTASGRAGGELEVIAHGTVDGARLEARATIIVDVAWELVPAPSVPPIVRDDFNTLPERDDPFRAASVVYPLDGALMPNNVGAPEIQWTPLTAADAFRIVLETSHARVVAYAYDDGAAFRSSFAVPLAAWRVIADSAVGEPFTVRVDRRPASRVDVVRGLPIDGHISAEGLFGTVYYWQVQADPQASDVLRLDTVTGARTSAFGTETGQCVGCHALSQDGRRLAATLDSRAPAWTTAVVDTTSATTPPADLFAPLSPAWHFLAFAPNGTRILGSRAPGVDGDNTRLALLDAETGHERPSSGLPTTVAGYPSWSPAGTHIAYMDGGGDGTRGTSAPTRIVVQSVESDDAFGAARVLHDGASLVDSLEGGSTDARPTWSPDGRFLVFAHGTRSVSATDIATGRPHSALYLVSVDGGAPVRLDIGMGAEGPTDAFWPVFAPFVTHEPDGTALYWLAFYSRQPYGNARAGTRGSQRRQLWVTAIDPERVAAGDPSHAPYWLPGQDPRADDIAALWAPTACRARDESCSASSECCSGECRAADPAQPDVLTCGPPPVCRPYGESCGDASDCCAGLDCNLNVCGYVPPI